MMAGGDQWRGWARGSRDTSRIFRETVRGADGRPPAKLMLATQRDWSGEVAVTWHPVIAAPAPGLGEKFSPLEAMVASPFRDRPVRLRDEIPAGWRLALSRLFAPAELSIEAAAALQLDIFSELSREGANLPGWHPGGGWPYGWPQTDGFDWFTPGLAEVRLRRAGKEAVR